jgi:hypothetical protein
VVVDREVAVDPGTPARHAAGRDLDITIKMAQ